MGFESYAIITLFHVLLVIVAVGAVTVTDYLHLIGLRKKRLERQLKNVYPPLSRLINISLALIYITGIALIIMNPSLLSSGLFKTKMFLVILVTLNGAFLQRKIAPNLDLCVLKGRKYCSSDVLYSSAICGGISIVTWYSLVVLAMTKKWGYSVEQFIIAYLAVLIIAIGIALHFEKKARKWHG